MHSILYAMTSEHYTSFDVTRYVCGNLYNDRNVRI